jgi:hypothetical protein
MGKVVRSIEKVFATWCLDIGRNMLATSSQHVHHKLATSLATCTLCQGRREGGATWKKVFATWEKCLQHEKRCSQHGKRCSQHSQHASQHHDPTADMFPDSNRVARKMSDVRALAVRAAVAAVRRPPVDMRLRSTPAGVNTGQHRSVAPFLFKRPLVSPVLHLGPSTVQKSLRFSLFLCVWALIPCTTHNFCVLAPFLAFFISMCSSWRVD